MQHDAPAEAATAAVTTNDERRMAKMEDEAQPRPAVRQFFPSLFQLGAFGGARECGVEIDAYSSPKVRGEGEEGGKRWVGGIGNAGSGERQIEGRRGPSVTAWACRRVREERRGPRLVAPTGSLRDRGSPRGEPLAYLQSAALRGADDVACPGAHFTALS